jgi:multidrug efflux system outer membrane protein
MSFSKKIVPILFVCASALSLNGCLVGPAYKQPETKAVDGYQDSLPQAAVKDTLRDSDWFLLFNDSVLKGYIDTALRHNFDVRIAALRIQEAQAYFGMVRADLYPSLNYGAGYGYYNFAQTGSGGLPDFGRYVLQAPVSWEIDLFGRIRHGKRAAAYSIDETIAYERGVRLSLITSVAEAYFKIADLDNRLRIINRTIASRQAYFDIIDARFRYGDVPELDKSQAEQQLQQAKALQYQLIRDLKATERSLALLLGQPPINIPRGLGLEAQVVNPMVPDGLPSELLLGRPDLRQWLARLQSQNEQIGVAVAMRYPRLELTGFLGLTSSGLDNLLSTSAVSGSIVAQLGGPIFQFGKNKNRVEREKFKYTQLATEFEQVYYQALVDVNNALTGVNTFKEELADRAKQVAAATKALQLSRLRYDSGYSSYSEVIINEQNLLSAELDYSAVQRGYLESYLQLYKAFGGGW